MAVFKYEWRQLRRYTLWWSIAVAALIFFMLPTYMSFLTTDTVDISAMGHTGFFELMDINPDIIATPLGTFGFLTSFFLLAAGISGLFTGFKSFSKETVGRSAEFLYTKPFRRSVVFRAKTGAALLSSFIIGACYFVGSLASGMLNIPNGLNFRAFSLIALSFLLAEVFFVLLGALLGSVYSKVRTPLLFSSGIVFVFYILSSLSSKADIPAIKFVTPFSYFSSTGIIQTGFYNIGYLLAFAVLCVAFAIGGFYNFTKRDITFIA